MTEAGNEEGVAFAIEQIGTQIAVGENIDQTLVQVSNQVLNSYLSDLINAYYTTGGDDDSSSSTAIINTDSLQIQQIGVSGIGGSFASYSNTTIMMMRKVTRTTLMATTTVKENIIMLA